MKMNKMCQTVPICFHCAALRPMSFLQMTNKRQWQICQGSYAVLLGSAKPWDIDVGQIDYPAKTSRMNAFYKQ